MEAICVLPCKETVSIFRVQLSASLCLSPCLSQRMAELCREQEGQADSPTALQRSHSEESPQGLALQLADSKAKVRRLKQQL